MSKHTKTDSDLLDAFEKNPNWELSTDRDPGVPEQELWRVHCRYGPINDTEWRLVATGSTAREAISNAIDKSGK